MAKDPADRFANAAELIAATEWLQSGRLRERSASRAEVAPQPVERPALKTQVMPTTPPSVSKPVRNSGGLKWAVAGVVLALLVFGALLVSQKRSQPSFSDSGSAVVAPREAVAVTLTDRNAHKGPVQGNPWTDPVTGIEFVWVPGNCFQMGCGPWQSSCDNDEKPLHEVCVDGFWMGKTR